MLEQDFSIAYLTPEIKEREEKKIENTKIAADGKVHLAVPIEKNWSTEISEMADEAGVSINKWMTSAFKEALKDDSSVISEKKHGEEN